MENYKQGIFFGLAAYVLWGILPVYWKALELVSPFEILSSRFMWSCVFVFLLIIFLKKWLLFPKEVKQVFSNVKTGAAMVAAGITISFNWGTFIWAVNNGHIVETSMGYYMCLYRRCQHGLQFWKNSLGFPNAGFYFCFVRSVEKNSAGFCLNKHYA